MNWRAMIALILICCGCNKERDEATRSSIQPMDVSSENFNFAQVPGILDDFSGSSCEQLAQLSGLPGNTGFQFFNQLENGNNPEGKVSLLNSPFLQVAVVKNFFIPTPKEALEIAEQDFLNSDQGLFDDIQWAAAQCLYHVGFEPLPDFNSTLCSIAGFFGLDQNSAREEFEQRIIDGVNEELGNQFPGIFGGQQGVQDSLYSRIFDASGRFNGGQENSVENISNNVKESIRSALPYLQLQPSNVSLDFTMNSAKSVLASFYSSTNLEERTCAVTLGYHQFNEWLNYMGVERPVFVNEDQGDQSASLNPITENTQKLETTFRVGQFINAQRNRVFVTEEMISDYDPKTAPLLPVNDRENVLSVLEMLSLMRAQLTTFVLTSPAEEWAGSNDQYLLGDITANGSEKVFPSEMHSLVLGLMTLNLQTLGQEYIKKINSNGSLLKEDEAAAGIVIGHPSVWQNSSVELNIHDAISLTHFAVDAATSLERLSKLSQAQLQEMNETYDKSTYERLLNMDNKESALYQLNSLHLGAALLLLKFTNEEGKCYEQITWNLNNGSHQVRNSCSENAQSLLKSTLEKLGHRTRSNILLQRSEQL